MAYEVHLAQFDGPLDLLLHLIERAELDIRDIFVSQITAQYLALMREAQELDMDTASEFLAMAATLLYIKSRTLLPRPPKEEEEEEDPEEALIRQLRAYKAFKEAGTRLAELREAQRGVFTKLPEETILPPQAYDILESDKESLYAALLTVLGRVRERTGRPIEERVRADAYTVREQIRKLRVLLGETKRVELESLFEGAYVKMELIVTLMALMDMLRRGEVKLEQDRQYGPITITAGTLGDVDGEDGDYGDEA